MADFGENLTKNDYDNKNNSSSSTSWLSSSKCLPLSSSTSFSPSSPSLPVKQTEEKSLTRKRKPGGWKAMPFVLGNETFERLASIGLLANFMVYLLNEFHLNQVFATNVINIWSGTTNFGTLLGAYLSDAHFGKFKTLAVASTASFLGMVTLTLTAALPQLRPPPCTKLQLQHNQCLGPSKGQLGVLFMGLGFLAIGAGGIRPCNIAFSVDQFDPTTEKGKKGIASFFNWYYFTFTIVMMLVLTVIVYIQESISWVWGFGVPTSCMLVAVILFFVGTRVYVYVPPGGSVFSGIGQVLVAAYKKRSLKLPSNEELHHVVYDPPSEETPILSKLPLTYQFSFLNKAAIVVDGEVNNEGLRVDKWRLCSIQMVEEVKCLIRIIPIWASSIISYLAMAQQGTFTVSQALKTDRHLGPNFQIPVGSLGVISMLTLGMWVPFYDQILVPRLRKITKHEGGITLLQRMGIGMVFAVLSMIAAAIFEGKRRASALLHASADGIAPISVLWLSPQLILMGLSEAFGIIGQIEFFYKQFPDNMKSFANSLLFCTVAGANYISTMVVAIVHKSTGKHGHTDWLDKNINGGRLDYFYYLLALLGVLNFAYYLAVASRYHYKGEVPTEGKDAPDIELNTTKHIDN